jgi:hypothetical protein
VAPATNGASLSYKLWRKIMRAFHTHTNTQKRKVVRNWSKIAKFEGMIWKVTSNVWKNKTTILRTVKVASLWTNLNCMGGNSVIISQKMEYGIGV